MKIISKYKDFYDGAQALGIDKTLLYKRFQETHTVESLPNFNPFNENIWKNLPEPYMISTSGEFYHTSNELIHICLLYTSPSPRDRQKTRMPSSA